MDLVNCQKRWRPFLRPLSFVYGQYMRFRNHLYDRGILRIERFDVPVISIGNLTVGGTGKTPATQSLTLYMLSKGLRPCIVSRGYGRRNPDRLVVVSDGEGPIVDPLEGGDEPVLLARNVPAPVVVCADRSRAIRFAVKRWNANPYILDDAFQRRGVYRDLDIVLIDAVDPFGDRLALPAGRLRESMSNIRRADIVILTRTDLVSSADLAATRRELEEYKADRKPLRVIETKMVPTRIIPFGGTVAGLPTVPKELAGFPIAAFCGLAWPDRFRATLDELKADVLDFHSFRDHYAYSQNALNEMAMQAKRSGAKGVLTTEKDLVKIDMWPNDAPPLGALGIEMKTTDGTDLWRDVIERISL